MPLFLVEAAPPQADPAAVDELVVEFGVRVGAAGGELIDSSVTADLGRIFAVVEHTDVSAVTGALDGLAVDSVELGRAPRDLERWDVVTRTSGGYRFAVPMIGVWIRRERSLDRLEREVRFINPRAHAYYELAVGAHRLILRPEHEGLRKEEVLQSIVQNVPVPLV